MINVTFAFTGRLGNLLFQVASLESYAREHGFRARYFHTDVTPKYASTILSGVSWEAPTSERFWDVRHPYFEYVSLPVVKASTRFHPPTYLQSEKYFNPDVARSLFFLRDTMKQRILAWYPELPECVSLHVRRGDYLKIQDCHPVLHKEYYEEAIKLLGNDRKYAIFSDDPDWCRVNLNIPNSVIVRGNTDEEELYMMSLCSDNIIANSSFSWWGAYLNLNPHKRVVAPLRWFGPKLPLNTKDLIPHTWIKI